MSYCGRSAGRKKPLMFQMVREGTQLRKRSFDERLELELDACSVFSVASQTSTTPIATPPAAATSQRRGRCSSPARQCRVW